jgi:hypothetical protein
MPRPVRVGFKTAVWDPTIGKAEIFQITEIVF